MKFDRRRFIEIAGAGTAGFLVDRPLFGEQPTTSSGVTLRLLLWGSALYAFSNKGTTLEVAYLTADPKVPGCTFMPHRPLLRFPAGGGRVIANESTITLKNGVIPDGEYRITSSLQGVGALSAVGLSDKPTSCAGPVKTVSSLGFVPTLDATGTKPAQNWRDRFAVRFKFEAGQIRAHAPFHGEQELARWEVRGPGQGAADVPFTDTLQLEIPLPGNRVTFESSAGKLTIGPVGKSKWIDARLMAHPAMTNAPALKAGDKEPHFCGLYAIFDPIPETSNRAELFFKDWCQQPTAKPSAVPKGPSPGKYCTGAKIMM